MNTMYSSYAPSNAAGFSEGSRPYIVDEAMYVITRAEDAFGNVIEETCRLVRPRPIRGASLRKLSELARGSYTYARTAPATQPHFPISHVPDSSYSAYVSHKSARRPVSPPSPSQLPEPFPVEVEVGLGRHAFMEAINAPGHKRTTMPIWGPTLNSDSIAEFRRATAALWEEETRRGLSDDEFDAMKTQIVTEYKRASPGKRTIRFDPFGDDELPSPARSNMSLSSNSNDASIAETPLTMCGDFTITGSNNPRQLFEQVNDSGVYFTGYETSNEVMEHTSAYESVPLGMTTGFDTIRASGFAFNGVKMNSPDTADIDAISPPSTPCDVTHSPSSRCSPSEESDAQDIPATRWREGDGCPFEFVLSGGRSMECRCVGAPKAHLKYPPSRSTTPTYGDDWRPEPLCPEHRLWPGLCWVANSGQGDVMLWLMNKLKEGCRGNRKGETRRFPPLFIPS